MQQTCTTTTGGRLAYRPRELAAAIGLSERAVRYLIRSGRLGHCRIGRRILIPARDAEQLLRRHAVRATVSQDVTAPIRPDAGGR
jgi:excisionase family DNA binding protein